MAAGHGRGQMKQDGWMNDEWGGNGHGHGMSTQPFSCHCQHNVSAFTVIGGGVSRFPLPSHHQIKNSLND